MARQRRGARDSEVHAYAFIKDKLKNREWDIRNPERTPLGQVWTQNECLSNPEIKRLLGLQKPENIVKISETLLWVFESKRSHAELSKALSEAEGYARQLNKSKRLKVQFITGVAGNDIDSFLMRTCYLMDNTYVPVTINGVAITGFLSPADCQTLLDRGSPNLDNVPVDETLFHLRATHINEILHLGAVNPHHRANVMAALLLSMIGGTEPNVNERDPSVLIQDINTRAESVLRQQKKPEFADQIRIAPPAAKDNHVKFRQALVDTLQELRDLNIRSAMNSGSDVLGTFYEVFIKYANWAQDLGIVLTPRHITRWAADVMDVQVNDIVYDPTCGTGGFLVAAFDYVKQRANKTQIEKFKQNGLFGIEQDSGIAALAIVNMIFRGDGKNNIIEANCLAKHLSPYINRGAPSAKWATAPSDEPPVTKVMMNPPFALPSSEDKEYKFVEQALRQMQDGKILFSILPYPSMVKGGGYKGWRKNLLLPHNTLLAVVTFPGDLFYPISMPAVGIFVQKGIPHRKGQHVLWVRAATDGFVKSKKKRLRSQRERDDLSAVAAELRAFIANPSRRVAGSPQLIKSGPIDADDKDLELVPEVYLDETAPSQSEILDNLDSTVRELISNLIEAKHEAQFCSRVFDKSFLSDVPPVRTVTHVRMSIAKLFKSPIATGDVHVSGEMDPGGVPLISTSTTNYGVEKMVEVTSEHVHDNAVTVACDGTPLTAFYHYYPFVAKDNVLVAYPARPYRFTTLLYIVGQINHLRWRFSYGRKCYQNKAHKIEILMPVGKDGALHEGFMEHQVKHSAAWSLLLKLFQ